MHLDGQDILQKKESKNTTTKKAFCKYVNNILKDKTYRE